MQAGSHYLGMITEYAIGANIKEKICIALIADLHDSPAEWVLSALEKRKPDLIAVCGDLVNAHIDGYEIYDDVPGGKRHLRESKNAVMLLEQASRLAPVFFSTGNHELCFDHTDEELLEELGVVYLNNTYTQYKDLVIGGLSSPYKVLAGTGKARDKEDSIRRWNLIFRNVNHSWLSEFEDRPGYKILLNHHPEYYDRYVAQYKKIDLILSGHTHGGQIRLFGKGLFAHGQGMFPKYSGGIYDGRMIVSRGLSNTVKIPRIGNPKELVFVRLKKND